jgi:hypothetical protein
MKLSNFKAFYLAKKALEELRDLRLYQKNHRSFEEYCRERFGNSRQKSNYYEAVLKFSCALQL